MEELILNNMFYHDINTGTMMIELSLSPITSLTTLRITGSLCIKETSKPKDLSLLVNFICAQKQLKNLTLDGMMLSTGQTEALMLGLSLK